MTSHLLVGKVQHRRSRPVSYGLEHDVFYAALDLDELDEVTGRSRLIRRNRRGLAEFRDADHLPEPGWVRPPEHFPSMRPGDWLHGRESPPEDQHAREHPAPLDGCSSFRPRAL